MGVLEEIAQTLDRIADANEQMVVQLNKIRQSGSLDRSSTLTETSMQAAQPNSDQSMAENRTKPLETKSDVPTVIEPACAITPIMAKWLQQHELGFDHYNDDISSVTSSELLANFMANKYPLVARLVKLLRRYSSGSKPVKLALKDEPPEAIGACCHVANALYQLGFSQYSHYKKAPQCELSIRLNGLPATASYINGRWFEQAIAHALNQYCSDEGVHYVRNLVIRLPNGQQREIDLVLQIRDQIYLIEAASGEWRQKLAPVTQLAAQIGLDTQHCLLITPEHDTAELNELAALHQMCILPYFGLQDWLEGELDQAFGAVENELEAGIKVC